MKALGDVEAGHTLGRYQLLVPVAQGGMAVVWAARMVGSRGFQKIVAVKTMLPEISEDAQFEEMFLAEAALASKIEHGNVCEVLDVGEQDGTVYMVMEWIDGEPLSALQKAARASGGVPVDIATRIVRDAALGLHAAHELRDETGELIGVVHRDVSPQNILVTYDGVVKVVDFGVAKATTRAEGVKTRAGQVKGKFPFMSPEQAIGTNVDRRTDVFALGIVLYQLTTGKHPFRKDNELETIREICAHSPAPRARQINDKVSEALDAVIAKALEKDLSKRYADMRELARALDATTGFSRSARSSNKTGTGWALVTLGPQRGATTGAETEDLAAFVKRVLGPRAEKRRAALKKAMAAIDDRSANGAISGVSGVHNGPVSGTTSALTALEVPSGVSAPNVASDPSFRSEMASDPSVRSGPASETAPVAILSPPKAGDEVPPSIDPARESAALAPAVVPPPSRSRGTTAALVLIAAAGVAIAVVALARPRGDAPPPAAAVAAAPSIQATVAPSPAPSATEAPVASATASAAEVASAAPPPSASTAVAVRGHGGGRVPKPADTSKPVDGPKVKDPGF